MIATLTRRNGRWVALWRTSTSEGAHITPDRQEAARALHAATDVWLGTGPVPAFNPDQALADYAEVSR